MIKKITVEGEKTREQALASCKNQEKMLHASNAKTIKHHQEQAAKILKATKCSNTKELTAHKTTTDAILNLEKCIAKEHLNAMQVQIKEKRCLRFQFSW